uniref:Uncharacterized protein LOC100182188 n=1 Tax=Phallusia mammillata TaxID=59560 RepID=A0A6F9DH21_9ASCI|nr:uncharacterized protein LOC100182188 [Phallusia mammillata]
MVRLLVYVALVSSLLCLVQGQINCYVCSDINFFGSAIDDYCYNNLTGRVATSCTGSCRMTFETEDGVIRSIERDCNSGSAQSLKCYSFVPSGNTIHHTQCEISCNTTGCNNMLANDLQACASSCGSTGGGFCNYYTGTCVCNAGYTGADCETVIAVTPTQSCIQCDEATEPGCASVTSTLCSSSSHNLCTASRTTLYDANGAAVRTTVTRGCIESFAVTNDECTFSTPADTSLAGFLEYTCTRTCKANGCNSFTPQGDAPGPMYCHMCTGTSDTSTCAQSPNTRTRCPSDQRYCYSRAIYRSSTAQSEITHNEIQGYQFVSIDRGCSSTAMASQCTNTTFPSSNGQLTTCQETCQTHGCNDGWPNRPKCIQCISDESSVAAGADDCLYNPLAARQCPLPYHQYCYYTDMGKSGQLNSQISENRGGYRRSMVRLCSVNSYGSTCTEFQNGGVTFQRCNKTCDTDGCNHGMGGGSFRPGTSFMTLFITGLLTYTTQYIFSH